MSLTVREMKDNDTSRWDLFVDQCEKATFFHRSEWRQLLDKTFGHRPHFLMAEQGEKL